jgi:lipoprotein-releasing system permease protein
MDDGRVFIGLSTARTLFTMPQGVTRIEIKLDHLNAAYATALHIRTLTGLDAVPWTDEAMQGGVDQLFPKGLRPHHLRSRARAGF